VSRVEESKVSSLAPDCVISIHEQVLLRIANGELNPQVTMLSDRLKIDGQAALGVYFFNLIAPEPQS
jgi:putative sterol carrier protein